MTAARYAVGPLAINAARFDDAVSLVMSSRDRGDRLTLHFCSANGVVEAARDARFRQALAGAGFLAPDGMPLVWIGRLRGFAVERVCGPDFMLAVLDRGRALGYRHYFYGGLGPTAERLAVRMTERFPGLEIVGWDTPPLGAATPEEDRTAVQRINAARPDCVWIGLSTPKQDIWAAAQRSHLEAPVVLAVGAAFDFHSGLRHRAPLWMQRVGLEWSYRLLREPRRLMRRYTITNARFLAVIFLDLARELARRTKDTPTRPSR